MERLEHPCGYRCGRLPGKELQHGGQSLKERPIQSSPKKIADRLV